MPVSFIIDCPGTKTSVVSRLDVRTKLAIGIMASVVSLVLSNPAALGVLALGSLGYALLLSRAKLLVLVYAMVIGMWILAGSMLAGMKWLWPAMAALEADKLTEPFLRCAVVVNVALALALSSPIQGLLVALKTLHLPFCIYVPLAVMIRFIPTFIEDVRQIGECIRTRGHRFTPASAILRPRLTLRLLLVPLLYRSLRSADELGVAAELKGLGGASRLTPMQSGRFGPADGLAAAAALIFLAAGVALQVLLPAGGGGMAG
jgi:energy-coupling factor transport system permease protein